ncbi:MAG: hypothetical protein QXU81_09890 [Candidatus Bathyarchaeia archaeon]
MKGGKKLVYVSEEVLEPIIEICRRDGITISRFIEDSLREAIRLRNLGYDLKRSADFLEVIRMHRVLGGAFVPQAVLDFMVGRVYSSDREGLLKQSFESGRLYGHYMRERFKNPIEVLKSFLEVSRWDLGEVEVSSDGDVWSLRCVSTVLSAEGTEMLAKFIEGVVKGLRCEILQMDFIKGIITVEFKR